MRAAVTLVLLGLAGCCLTPVADQHGGSSSGTAGVCGAIPTNHRPSDAQCQTTAPPGNYSCSGECPTGGFGQTFACNNDGECDAGLEGRCVEGCCIASSRCTYDQCTVDTDCPSNDTCACHGSPYLSPYDNTCVPSDCRVDADCESGCDCSPSQQAGCYGCISYHCHTPQDLCVNDGDCQAQDPLGAPFCIHSSDAGHWICISIQVPE